MKKDFNVKMAHKEELMKSKDESIKWIRDKARNTEGENNEFHNNNCCKGG